MIKQLSCFTVLILLLSSCGFQLRGSWKEDLVNQNINIVLKNSEALEQDIYFRSQLERYLSLYNLHQASDKSLNLVIQAIEHEAFTSAIDLNREETTAELLLTVRFTLENIETGNHKSHQSKSYQISEQQFLSSAPADPNTSEAQALLINQEMGENAAQKVTEAILKALADPSWQFEHEQP